MELDEAVGLPTPNRDSIEDEFDVQWLKSDVRATPSEAPASALHVYSRSTRYEFAGDAPPPSASADAPIARQLRAFRVVDDFEPQPSQSSSAMDIDVVRRPPHP